MAMTEDGEVEKNFRSSYYGSLGFRAGEKSLGYLKGLLKAEVLGRQAIATSVNCVLLYRTCIARVS